jgi:hypothetical protein
LDIGQEGMAEEGAEDLQEGSEQSEEDLINHDENEGNDEEEEHPDLRNDDDNEGSHIIDESLPPILGKDDPRRMKLTRAEYQWALEVKNQLQSIPELDHLSDFMYAQLAVFTRGDLQEAEHRARGLQEFVQEFKILNTYEEGCRLLRFMVQMFPRQFLSFTFSDLEGTYVLAQDIAHFDTTVLKTLTQTNKWFVAAYYLHATMTPDLATIRKGHVVLLECQGVDWTAKQNFKLIQRMFIHLLRYYPIKGEMRHYHTGIIVNMLTSMVKGFLCKETRELIKMGLTLDSRLDQLFLVPNVAAANARMMVRLQETLKRRYENEKSFSLTP